MYINSQIFFVPYPTFTHLNITIIISIHISPLERTHSFSLLGEIMRPLTEEILMQPEPLSFFSPTDSCTDATAQQTAGAQPYQQAKEVPLLQTKAWQLTVMHRLDFSDNLLFAPPTSPCNLAPYATNQRCKLRWAQISPDTLKICQRDLCGEAVLHVQLCLYQWGH